MRALLLLVPLLCIISVSAKHKRPPNVVVILADDLGWNDVSFHGSNQIPTPNIDALAYDGIILNNYYVQPICTPTRSALMTGRYPIRTGLQRGVISGAEPYGLGLDETILPQHLKTLGYKNHIVGKWHLGFFEKEYMPTFRGFDSHYGYLQGSGDYYKHTYWSHPLLHDRATWDGYDFRDNMNIDKSARGRYSTQIFTERAEKLIRNHNQTQPLFLYLAHQAVHVPLAAPQKYIDKFKHIKNKTRRKYAAMVSVLDESVGNVTKALARAGMLDNTVIIFSTDNGGPVNGYGGNAASNWPLRGCKTTLWEGGTRGAAFVWSPLLKKSRYVSQHLMHVTDIFPTVLSIAGYDMTNLDRDRIDGLDMWHTLSTEEDSSPRVELLYNMDSGKHKAALRVHKYKLIHGSQGPMSGWYPPWQLDANLTSAQVFSSSFRPNDLDLNEGLDPNYYHDASQFTSDLPTMFENILNRQQPATKVKSIPVSVRCGKRPSNATADCNPHKAACLFDLDNDPCEFNNLASVMPDAVKAMQIRLESYRAHEVQPRGLPEDIKGAPIYHNGNWVPWRKLSLW